VEHKLASGAGLDENHVPLADVDNVNYRCHLRPSGPGASSADRAAQAIITGGAARSFCGKLTQLTRLGRDATELVLQIKSDAGSVNDILANHSGILFISRCQARNSGYQQDLWRLEGTDLLWQL